MRRILLFAATNLAVLTLLSVLLNVLGVDQWLYREGRWTTLDYRAARQDLAAAHRTLTERLEENP